MMFRCTFICGAYPSESQSPCAYVPGYGVPSPYQIITKPQLRTSYKRPRPHSHSVCSTEETSPRKKCMELIGITKC